MEAKKWAASPYMLARMNSGELVFGSKINLRDGQIWLFQCQKRSSNYDDG